MQNRFGRVLFCLGMAALVLLLFSALVEGPVVVAESRPAPFPVENATLWPMAQSPVEPVHPAPWPSVASRLATALAEDASLATPAMAPCADANGRVLRTPRYVKSAYPLFHQEQACP